MIQTRGTVLQETDWFSLGIQLLFFNFKAVAALSQPSLGFFYAKIDLCLTTISGCLTTVKSSSFVALPQLTVLAKTYPLTELENMRSSIRHIAVGKVTGHRRPTRLPIRIPWEWNRDHAFGMMLR
jgi:hypothetical protein